MRTAADLLILALLAGPAFGQASEAEYLVTFEATWSGDTHPSDFPGNAHFSGLVGATHDASVTFWTVGGEASAGIESMAETGSKTALLAEVDDAIQFGRAGGAISGGGIGVSPGTVSVGFTAHSDYPLVTLVSMVAPSPDWFVGVSGLNLYENNAWAEVVEVDLFVYDAGTDSGTTYTAADEDTSPQEPIARLETTPFFVDGAVRQVGTYRFERQHVTAVDEDAVPDEDTHLLRAAYPNPFRQQATLTLTVARRQHVRAALYDLRGRRVAALWDGPVAPDAPHHLIVEAGSLPAGVYLVRVTGEAFQAHRPIVLTR